MARRKTSSALDDLFALLMLAPTWLGPLLAAGTFCLFRFVIPLFLRPTHRAFDAGSALRPMMPMLSWLGGGAVLAVWIIAELHKLSDRRLLDRQSGTPSIRELP